MVHRLIQPATLPDGGNDTHKNILHTARQWNDAYKERLVTNDDLGEMYRMFAVHKIYA